MKEIVLANNKGTVLIDDGDFNKVSRHKWFLKKVHTGGFYAITNTKCDNTKSGHTTTTMHRMILNPRQTEQVDHINHNELDNRKINLRICDQSQNSGNARKCKKKTSSQYKGVRWHIKGKKWEAYIKFNYSRIQLGSFDTEDLAALEYNKKAIELFGEFAYLNMVVG